MSKKRLVSSVEIIINETIKRQTKLSGKDKTALKSEFREWIDGIGDNSKSYDVLFMNKIESH
tara:strand:- start:269 stop:454 length:186 start_codon:yes stop_codon:yes gene_type:complete